MNAYLSTIPVADLSRHIQKHRSRIESAIDRVLDRGHFILGEEVTAFEESFAAYIGVRYCVGTANGTDAIELALRATGIGNGTKVATVGNAGNYTTTALNAIGAVPIYMDVDPLSRNVTLFEVSQAIKLGAEVVVVTHLYGMAVAEIEEISRLCRLNSIPLIEDCAQATGAEINNKKIGSFGDASSFSFYPTKNLGAIGDAGAVTTSNDEIAEKLKKLRVYGWGGKYNVDLVGGRNSRLDEVQAAILSGLLPFLDEENNQRRKIATFYSTNISSSDLQVPKPSGSEFVSHLYVISSTKRTLLQSHLHSVGIATAVHYPIPDHKQSVTRDYITSGPLQVTEGLSNQVLTLPCFPEMTEAEISRVVDALNGF